MHFFKLVPHFTKPYEFPISNGTGPITTAQPSLNIDTPFQGERPKSESK